MSATLFVAWTLYAASLGFAAGIVLGMLAPPRTELRREGFNVVEVPR